VLDESSCVHGEKIVFTMLDLDLASAQRSKIDLSVDAHAVNQRYVRVGH